MAGGGGQMKAERTKRGSNSNRKKKKRVGFFVDLTPLVDITFLLLTFFMFTTTMAEPQVMEMKLPPEVNETIDVKASELFTIYVRNDNKIYYIEGLGEAQEITIAKLRAKAEDLNLQENTFNKLITAVKAESKASYGIVVNILDELNLAEVRITNEVSERNDPVTGAPMERARKFTIAPVTEEERVKIYPEGLPAGSAPATTGTGGGTQ